MRVTVVGASGKMGRAIVETLQDYPKAQLVAAITSPSDPLLGEDVGDIAHIGAMGIALTHDFETALKHTDVVIDFTQPEATAYYVSQAMQTGTAYVTGTTGFNSKQENFLKNASNSMALVKSGNMSLGVNLLAALVKKAAQSLKSKGFDIEITEMHHRYKRDAPSGTALLLGEAAAQGQEIALKDHMVCARAAHGAVRQAQSIGFSSLRGGTVIGDHSVIFAGEQERLVLSHFAQDRKIFARGALEAAFWVQNKAHGLYSMQDVLGLNDV